MAILPTFAQLPGDGVTRLILIKTCSLLKHELLGAITGPLQVIAMDGTTPSSDGPASAVHACTQSAASASASAATSGILSRCGTLSDDVRAADATVLRALAVAGIETILRTRELADADYCQRAWTLVERMARHGHGDTLSNWLPLGLWLGMVLHALLTATSAGMEAVATFRQLLGDECRPLFDALVDPMSQARETSSILIPACEGLIDSTARLVVAAARMWASRDQTTVSPDARWIRSYLLEDLPQGLYHATRKADIVWSVFSFLSTKWDMDLNSDAGLRVALEDMCRMGGVADDARGAPEPELKGRGFKVCAKLYETVGLEEQLGDILGPIRKV